MRVIDPLKVFRLGRLQAAALIAAFIGVANGGVGPQPDPARAGTALADVAAVGDDTGEGGAAALAVSTSASAAGFGRGVTGGAGGATVRVTTPAQLKHELCRTFSGGKCTDTTPRIIEIASTIDFTDSEGTGTAKGCNATAVCTPPVKSEVTLLLSSTSTHCNGKALFDTPYKIAGVRGLSVGSNKTIIGVGKAGVILGKGLQLQDAVSNIVIRNLSFTDINPGLVFGGDAITIADATHVWIDHNHFARIGRQFIATGTGDHSGASDNVTISWNEFDGNNAYSSGCNGQHYWNLLFNGKGSVTFANNWLHDFAGRGPQIAGDTLVHLVNNYFQNGSWHALNPMGRTTHVLVEGNDFENVSVPILRNSDVGPVYAVLGQTTSAKANCTAALGRACAPNIVNPLPAVAINSFTQDSAVLTAANAVVASGKVVSPYPAQNVAATVSAGAGVDRIN